MQKIQDVLSDLKRLVTSKGYIYSLCLILFEDFHHDINQIHKVDSRSKLSVKECALILGLLVQTKIDFREPDTPEKAFILKEKTYELMTELHSSFNAHFIPKFERLLAELENRKEADDTPEERLDFFVKDGGMVEPMFYAGDGVYDFQYLEFLDLKYRYDTDWLSTNRRFDINQTKEIINQIKRILHAKAQKVNLVDLKQAFRKIFKKARKKLVNQFTVHEIDEMERQQFIAASFYQYVNLFPSPPKISESDNSTGWSAFYQNLLSLFIITPSDFKDIDTISVDSFFQNFSFEPPCNVNYNGPGHFNILNSRPLIKFDNEHYFIPITYLVHEACYESPFYWMMEDKGYRNTLAKHRGDVGEEIAYQFLSKVFGAERTFRSVKVETKKGERSTDIDVLCLLGNKALCVQVKSKKITLTAKRGDFGTLQKDFKAAIQDAYNQGIVSREAILDKKARFIDSNANQILLSEQIDEVYIMGLTTENYPSLVHQVQMMLNKKIEDPYPIFLSVFDLELLAHYLDDPYDFLFYIRQRINLSEYWKADEELVYLGFHLKHKLERMDRYDGGMLENEYGAIIDRNYYPYKTGLTHLLNPGDDPLWNRGNHPLFDKFLLEIKSSGHPKATDIIFHFLDLSLNTRTEIVQQMSKYKIVSEKEGTPQSLATSTSDKFGFSLIILNGADPQELTQRVIAYADLRKYVSKRDAWLGMGSFANSNNFFDFFYYNDEPWALDTRLETEVAETLTNMRKNPFTPMSGRKKVGRNDPCPCKSGNKYKHCCLH